MKKNTKILKIIKQNTDYTSDYTEDTEGESSEQSPYIFPTLSNNPSKTNRKSNLTKEDIAKKLEGYRVVDNKRQLLKLKPYKVSVRYYNKTTKEFKAGGLLMKVDPELRYIMLVNLAAKLSWSVQLDNSIIFIPDTTEQDLLKKKEEKEIQTKEKLYQLYLKGKLALS